jgi:hypothetical protein
MPDKDPSRLEMFKAGKIEDRRSRPRPVPVITEVKEEEVERGSLMLRPEIIAIGLLIAVLLVITAIAL